MNDTAKSDERMDDDSVKAKNSAMNVKIPYGLKQDRYRTGSYGKLKSQLK